nr:hypothetical protein [Mammaliicoccus sp. Marseille-Q6498]
MINYRQEMFTDFTQKVKYERCNPSNQMQFIEISFNATKSHVKKVMDKNIFL